MTSVSSKKKTKKLRDDSAPKAAVTAFIHFSNERREIVRGKNPEVSFAALSKLISGEWNSLSAEEKKKYFDAAQRDRERYQKEMEEYQQSDAYRVFELHKKHVNDKKRGEASSSGGAQGKAGASGQRKEANSMNIPIFTEEFLEHNRCRDNQLRQLRKSISDCEEQNAILGKHIERMKMEVDKQQSECCDCQQQVATLREHLSIISQFFSDLPLPGHEAATPFNIHSYMSHLRKLCLDHDHGSNHDVAIKLAQERCHQLLTDYPHLFS